MVDGEDTEGAGDLLRLDENNSEPSLREGDRGRCDGMWVEVDLVGNDDDCPLVCGEKAQWTKDNLGGTGSFSPAELLLILVSAEAGIEALGKSRWIDDENM